MRRQAKIKNSLNKETNLSRCILDSPAFRFKQNWNLNFFI